MKKSHYYQALVRLMVIFSYIYSVIAAADENNLIRQQFISEAEQFVISQLDPDKSKTIEVSAMPIDKRIQLPNCPKGLIFSASVEAMKQSNVTLKAQCDQSSWYMFLVVRVKEIQPVVVLSSAVSPGTLLTRNNTHVINMDKKRLRSTTFADIEQVVGARIKRRGVAGRPVEPSNLCYVCKGDSVVISAGSSGMRVKTSGVALEDGNMGDTIQVKNQRSSKRIHARVASTGQVEVSI